jgi:ankyrin repeat protein
LHDAALGGHRDLVALLLDHGADPEAREAESGSTPLYVAASMGRLEVVELLLARGAVVNAANKSGATPLHAAMANGFGQVAAVLRAHGAK